MILVTKVGYKDFTGQQDFSSDYIKSSLDKSLERLKSDYVDIYQLHDIQISLLDNSDEILPTLIDLKKGEKSVILEYPLNLKKIASVIDKKIFNCMQINFNLIDQRANENGLFKKCIDNNVAIIGRTPLCFGFLTENIIILKFHEDDHRKRWSKEQIELWSSAYKIFFDKIKNSQTKVTHN